MHNPWFREQQKRKIRKDFELIKNEKIKFGGRG